MGTKILRSAVAASVLGVGLAVASATPAHAAVGDVTTFLGDNSRSSFYGAESRLTAATAPQLAPTWASPATSSGASAIVSQPMVVDGVVYWGDGAGYEHATNEATGAELWRSNGLGAFQPSQQVCPGWGVTGISGAATVATVNGRRLVFVASGTSVLYALDAASGAIVWQATLGSPPNDMIYSATNVLNGSVYVVVASNGDCPSLTQGRVYKLDAATGNQQARFNVVPDGCIGGGIWGSATIDVADDALYVATGNGSNPGVCAQPEPYAQAIVKLRASTLAYVDSWQQPDPSTQDHDFGSTPTLFTGKVGGQTRNLVGVVNKNGTFYAFDRASLSSGPVWTYQASDPGEGPEQGYGSIAPAAWDGATLYVGGEIQAPCRGTLSALDPTVAPDPGTKVLPAVWRNCLDGAVVGAVSAAPGIVVVGAGPNLEIFRSIDGAQLFHWTDNAPDWFESAPTIAQGQVFGAKTSGVLYALGLPGSPPSAQSGYWMVGSTGTVYGFGAAHAFGDAAGHLSPGAHAVHIEPTPDFGGYWIVDNLGHVYAFGDAHYYGGATGLTPGESIASLSSTVSGRGYWLFTSKGRALPHGDAVFYGDMAGRPLNGPVLDSVATPDGRGYYMVASDGGIFAFGDAAFKGSMGGKHLNGPVVGLAPDAASGGYWLVASDGGIFAFGGAAFHGSMGGRHLNKPVIGMVAYGNGYLMVASDGGIFNFSSKPFVGSLGANPPPNPIVGVAALNA